MEPTQACYWIVGSDNTSQAPAVVVDLHDARGSVVSTYSHTLSQGAGQIEAHEHAKAYAASKGVHALFYDADSTQAFSYC